MARIGVLTGGGDCPGLNPAVKWVVKTACMPDAGQPCFDVYGIRDGWRGLVKVDPSAVIKTPDTPFGEDGWVRLLTPGEIRTWDRFGGTRLGTSRTNPFNPKDDQSVKVVQNIKALKLDALIAIGGEDTLGVAARLHGLGVPVVGIPKTIDLDLWGSDYTLGFETAINVITEEVDRLRTTAGSHSRTFVVETMGRTAGHLALQGGLATGADIILIPEYDFDMDEVNALLSKRRESHVRYSIVTVAEGAKERGGEHVTHKSNDDQFRGVRFGGIGEVVARAISEGTGHETRAVVLSHLQRGGTPCAYDRRMGRAFGIAAVNLVQKGISGRMVAFREGKITSMPIVEVLDKLHLVDLNTEYDTTRYNGVRHLV